MFHVTPSPDKARHERGFTLVEMVIVILIIGLLLAGMMKFGEVIENRRVLSTISQAENFKEAVKRFQDIYRVLPGDMATAESRLPNCDGTIATQCYNAGTNAVDTGADGAVGPVDGLGGIIAASTEERVQFWRHLLAVDLLTQVNASGNLTFEGMMPNSPLGGGWRVGHESGGNVMAGQGTENVNEGIYIELVNDPTGPTTGANAGELPLLPVQAAQIDRKIDDNTSISGFVVGYGPASCFDLAVESGYNEPGVSRDCGLYIFVGL